MTKWKCTAKLPYGLAYCAGVCELTSLNKTDEPSCCVIHHINGVKWKRVSEEPEQKQEENTLPDWCKVGEWVYEKERKEYFKITKVDCLISMQNADGKGQYGHGAFADKCVQARLRPWTFEEAPAVLKVKDSHGFALAYLSPFGGKYIIAYHHPDEYEKMKLGEVTFTFSAFADIFTQIDGKPCGVLEHMENGDWEE